jgi:YesN/AraC family two-component response regulator
MSITQISAKLGFNNPDYFSRLFKKIVGITASEFRREGFRL